MTDGCFRQVEYAGVLKGTKNPDAARAVVGGAQDVLLGVTNARAKVGSIQMNADSLNDEAALKRFGLVRDQIHFMGNYSLAIIAVSGLFVGFVLSLQGYYTLQRYGSAEALADDLRRWQEGRPVLARGDAPAYLLGWLVRRHRVAVAGAGAVLASLVVGLAGTQTEAELLALAQDPDAAKATFATLALARRRSPALARLLTSPHRDVLNEAVRAIHDDEGIPAAQEALAGIVTNGPAANSAGIVTARVAGMLDQAASLPPVASSTAPVIGRPLAS